MSQANERWWFWRSCVGPAIFAVKHEPDNPNHQDWNVIVQAEYIVARHEWDAEIGNCEALPDIHTT